MDFLKNDAVVKSPEIVSFRAKREILYKQPLIYVRFLLMVEMTSCRFQTFYVTVKKINSLGSAAC